MFQKHGMSGARRKSTAKRPKYLTCCHTLFRKKEMCALSKKGVKTQRTQSVILLKMETVQKTVSAR